MATAAPPQFSAPNLAGRAPANQVPGVDPRTGVPQYQPQPQYAPQLQQSAPAPGAAGGIGIDGFGPIMSNYLRQFNASIGKSRANVDMMLHQTLGELAGRRDAAAKIVAGMPAEIGANTSAGQAALGSDASNAALGLRAGAAGQARIGPAQLQANMAQDAAGAVPAAKYLGLANQANYDTGSTALNQQAFAANQALDEQQRNFEQELHLKQLDSKTANDQFYAHTKYQHDLNVQDAKAAHDQAIADAAAGHATAQTDKADQEVDANTGGQIKTQAELESIRSSAPYRYAVNSMTQTGFNAGLSPSEIQQLKDLGINPPTSTGAEIAKKYSGNPKLLYALLADNRIKAEDLAQAGITLPGAAKNPLAGK